jgi:hypothetical protein
MGKCEIPLCDGNHKTDEHMSTEELVGALMSCGVLSALVFTVLVFIKLFFC